MAVTTAAWAAPPVHRQVIQPCEAPDEVMRSDTSPMVPTLPRLPQVPQVPQVPPAPQVPTAPPVPQPADRRHRRADRPWPVPAHESTLAPKRVLLLSDCYRPTINGVVTSLVDLQRALLDAGHDVRVLTVAHSSPATFDGQVYRLPSVAAGIVYPQARIGRPVDRRLFTELVRWGPQVLHTHTEFVAFWWARRLSDYLGAPHVHTYHTLYEDYTHYFCPHAGIGRAISAGLTRAAMNRLDLVVTPTAKIQSLLRGYGVRRPITVVPTGVDLGRFGPGAHDDPATAALRAALGLEPGLPVVLSLGRLAVEKNLTETVDLLASIRHRPWQFVVVGDGPHARALRDQVHRLGLAGRVRFVGAVPPERVPAYYRLGDVFVSSSRSETQGLTYLEALASGLPVVCRADPSFDGVVVDGHNGHQYRGAGDFADTLSRLLLDPQLRRRWGRGAAQTASGFGLPVFAESMRRAYDRALGARARGHRTAGSVRPARWADTERRSA